MNVPSIMDTVIAQNALLPMASLSVQRVRGAGATRVRALAVLTLAFCDGGYSRTTISFYSTSAPDMNASTA